MIAQHKEQIPERNSPYIVLENHIRKIYNIINKDSIGEFIFSPDEIKLAEIISAQNQTKLDPLELALKLIMVKLNEDRKMLHTYAINQLNQEYKTAVTFIIKNNFPRDRAYDIFNAITMSDEQLFNNNYLHNKCKISKRKKEELVIFKYDIFSLKNNRKNEFYEKYGADLSFQRLINYNRFLEIQKYLHKNHSCKKRNEISIIDIDSPRTTDIWNNLDVYHLRKNQCFIKEKDNLIYLGYVEKKTSVQTGKKNHVIYRITIDVPDEALAEYKSLVDKSNRESVDLLRCIQKDYKKFISELEFKGGSINKQEIFMTAQQNGRFEDFQELGEYYIEYYRFRTLESENIKGKSGFIQIIALVDSNIQQVYSNNDNKSKKICSRTKESYECQLPNILTRTSMPLDQEKGFSFYAKYFLNIFKRNILG